MMQGMTGGAVCEPAAGVFHVLTFTIGLSTLFILVLHVVLLSTYITLVVLLSTYCKYSSCPSLNPYCTYTSCPSLNLHCTYTSCPCCSSVISLHTLVVHIVFPLIYILQLSMLSFSQPWYTSCPCCPLNVHTVFAHVFLSSYIHQLSFFQLTQTLVMHAYFLSTFNEGEKQCFFFTCGRELVI